MTDLQIVKLLGTRFIARKNVKAFQGQDGQWFPAKCDACRQADLTCLHLPMTMADFDAHLAGTKTMGHYLLEPEGNTVKFFAFDLDVRKPTKPGQPDPYVPLDSAGQPYNPREALLLEGHPMANTLRTQLRCLAEGIARRTNSTLGVPVAIADSGGKGLHVYAFTGTIPAEAAREMAQGILLSYGVFEATRGQNFWRHKLEEYADVEIETFPKQAAVSEDGLGNLMKLPLGIHRKTGKPSRFLTTKAPLEVFSEMDPIRALEGDLPWE